MNKRIPDETVVQIRKDRKAGMTLSQVAAKHDVSRSMVSRIDNGSRRTDVPIVPDLFETEQWRELERKTVGFMSDFLAGRIHLADYDPRLMLARVMLPIILEHHGIGR